MRIRIDQVIERWEEDGEQLQAGTIIGCTLDQLRSARQPARKPLNFDRYDKRDLFIQTEGARGWHRVVATRLE